MNTQFFLLRAALMVLPIQFSTAQVEGGIAATPTDAVAVRANGRIAFTSNRDGNLEIYTMNSDGSEQTRLTNNPGIDAHPAWSADGSKLAWVSQVDSRFAIKTVNPDGGGEVELTPIAYSPSPYPWHDKWSMSWSPDGKKIAFQESDDIIVIDRDGSNRTNLTNHPARDGEPAWSPDGTRILFTSSRVYWITLHSMNPDGSDVRELPSADEFWDMSPDWSPAGNKIVFILHSEMWLPAIYTANADGTNRQLFDQCGSGMCSVHRNKPKWAPDGTKILFHMWDYFGGDCQIYAKNLDGAQPAKLTSDRQNFQPSWQSLEAVK
jgi:Tol biopolymer transport system component